MARYSAHLWLSLSFPPFLWPYAQCRDPCLELVSGYAMALVRGMKLKLTLSSGTI